MAPSWAPTLRDVGGCIPTRTVNVNLPGNEVHLGTFTEDTYPTAEQAQDKIDQACADVLKAVATVGTDLEDPAKNAAMWRAAADAELAYPDRTADVNHYEQLNARAKYAWELFLNAAASQGTGDSATLPVWYSQDSPWWADRADI